MTPPEEHRHDDLAGAAREGVFDFQLSLPWAAAPQPVRTVVKRDGRRVPFEVGKIAGTIFRAAQAIGGEDHDRAEGLASGVAIYLAKTFGGDAPTVEQVSDAVENVLIEMGHAKTALAYARYRDKRSRMRRLRAGDTRAFLTDANGGPWEREALDALGGGPALVRTSHETLAEWDRQRIVSALITETGLEAEAAERIAEEVEEQIRAAGVKSLTAPLVRELVDAKLVERGLEEYRRRHMRLGVPLYDAESLICTPNRDASDSMYDPAGTNRILAERVKKEFALTQVFSQEVADAHLRGDLHLHDLGLVDCLEQAVLSPECLTRFGLSSFGARGVSNPPSDINGLLGQMGKLAALLSRHFSRGVVWDAPNLHVAPFVKGSAPEAVQDAAQHLVDACARPAGGCGIGPEPPAIILPWTTPEYLTRREAIGPRGEGVGRDYGSFEHASQQIAQAVIDLCARHAADGLPSGRALPVVPISEAFLRSPGSRGFLSRVAEAICHGCGIRFVLARQGEGDSGPRDWRPAPVTAHRVTVNLARLAYSAANEEALLTALERLVALAVRAHSEKESFIRRLFGLRDIGPLAVLATEREGMPFVRLGEARYLVAFCGLNECVQSITGREMHVSEDALALGGRVMACVQAACQKCSEREGTAFAVAETDDSHVLRRLATLDLQQHPHEAGNVVKSDAREQEVHYTGGIRLRLDSGISAMERVRIEGRLHALVEGGAFTRIAVPEGEMSRGTIASFVEKAFWQTESRAVEFVPAARA